MNGRPKQKVDPACCDLLTPDIGMCFVVSLDISRGNETGVIWTDTTYMGEYGRWSGQALAKQVGVGV